MQSGITNPRLKIKNIYDANVTGKVMARAIDCKSKRTSGSKGTHLQARFHRRFLIRFKLGFLCVRLL